MQENLYTPDCIRTFSGRYVNVFEPSQEMICIEDIAHSLSMQCRFAGHLKRFYSVADHCVNVAYLGNSKFWLGGLLHDASEAYLMDIPSPIKKKLPDYQKIEANLMCCIAAKFGFEYPLNSEIKKYDKELLELEWRQLVLNDKGVGLPISKNQTEAKIRFMDAFKRYEVLKEIFN